MQAGITQFNDAHRQKYVSFWASEWTDDELQRIQVKRGDPAGQARVEALTLLYSVFTWSKVIRESAGSLAIMGDALGVLHDATKFRANGPILNSVMAELALILAPMGHDLRAVHLWTQGNSTCDDLSRLAEKKAIPDSLHGTARCKKRNMKFRVLSPASEM